MPPSGMNTQTVKSIGRVQKPVLPGTVRARSGRPRTASEKALIPPKELTMAMLAATIPPARRTHCKASVQATLLMPPIIT